MDTQPSRRRPLVALLVVAVVGWMVAPTLLLGQAGEARSEASAEVASKESLRQSLVERYRVLPVSGGVLLTPKNASEFESLEVRNGDLSIDGRAADLSELAALLGREEAGIVASLLGQDGEALHRLFGFAPKVESESASRARSEADTESLRVEAGSEAEAIQGELESARRAEAQALDGALDEARRSREVRAEELRQELAEIEESHRAITEELEERSAELRRRERERQSSHRRPTSTGESRVVVGSSVEVGEDERVGDAVAVGGNVTVEGKVDSDAIAIGGQARINGEVGGGVVAVGGAVYLGENSLVEGDVVSVGGKVHREPGARVEGQTTEVNWWGGLLGPWSDGFDWDFGDHRPRNYFDGAIGDFFGSGLRALLLGLVGLLLILFSRRRLERVAAYAGAEPVKAGLVGLVSYVMFLPLLVIVAVVMAISIVGIPLLLLLPFAFVGFLLIALYGYLSVAYRLGRWSQQRFGWRVLEPVAALVIGLLWLHGWELMANVIDIVDGPRDFAGFLVIMLYLFGIAVKICAWSVGLGAVLLSWGERRASRSSLPPLPPDAPLGNFEDGSFPSDTPSSDHDPLLDIDPVADDSAWDRSSDHFQGEDGEHDLSDDGGYEESYPQEGSGEEGVERDAESGEVFDPEEDRDR
ncbi:MAG: hypothetical protein K8J08_16565 [Thermoanaerobaculia bacterium]|nr:hypothetical protein [Thermoanaerobaculia bacterium]